jgi:hypothetical protein
MNAREVDDALTLDAAWKSELKQRWLALAGCAVFGAVGSSRIGGLPKARRRVLELGERLAALFADRAWIPHPRERLKNALASALALRETLDQLDRAAAELDRGAEIGLLRECVRAVQGSALAPLEALELRWVGMLDAQLRDADDAQD